MLRTVRRAQLDPVPTCPSVASRVPGLLLAAACLAACGGGGSATQGLGSHDAGSHASSASRASSAGSSARASSHEASRASSAGSSRASSDTSTSAESGSTSSSRASSSTSKGADDAGAGLFAACSLAGGCLADCSPPANDPIATGDAQFDLYDGCILAGMKLAGMTEPWQGKLLKSQAYNESGITPKVTTNDTTCGGQNCGIWAISAGTISGDSPPGPCGSSKVDPFTGEVDYSHSYGLFQETPACEGTFLLAALPSGYHCTGTTKANNIAFGSSITFYCESATALGVMTDTGTVKGYIDAVQDTTDPLYATSILNPAYQLYVYLDHTWALNFAQANAGATGCTEVERWYLSLAYWLTGNPTASCALTGAGKQYVKTAITDYETVLYNTTWPYPGP